MLSNVRVRLALPAEASDIVALQRAAWANDPLMGPLLEQMSVDEMVQVWHAAIVRPPLAHYRVLVALEDDRVVGFTAVGPSDDPDATERDSAVIDFLVDESARGLGHSSRLLNAAVDTMRTDGYLRATWWLNAGDDELRAFLVGTGWGPDGAHREVTPDDEDVRVKQVRLHTDISPGNVTEA